MISAPTEIPQGAFTLETVGCPVCGGPGEPRFEQTDLLCGVGGTFGQRRCVGCEMFFLSPRVPEAQIGLYYPPSYPCYQEDRHSPLIRKLAGKLELTLRKRRIIERFLRGGRVLDVGCGNGFFLRTLEGGSWERYAMDTKWHGAGLPPGEFHEGLFDHQPPRIANLDAITLWHVFEHLYHPEKALENAAAILRAGGLLFLAVPDLRSIEPRLFGRYWVGWDPPRHVATYSRRGLETLLGRAGFRLVGVVPDVCTGELFLLSVDFLLRSRGFVVQVRDSLALRLLLAPLVYCLTRLGLAPAKVYVAQR